MISKKYQFDEVFDTQKLFRLLLDGMANPFRRESMVSICEGFTGARYPAALALGELLLDPEVSFSAPGEVELEAELHDLTGAAISAPDAADYLFVTVSSGVNADFLAKLKSGTLDEPEKSCTVIVLLTQNALLTIQPNGPGIPDGAEYEIEQEAIRLMRENYSLGIQFPCGKDFIFVSPVQELYCWPRTSRVEEVESWHM